MEQARRICLRLTEEDLANGFKVTETENSVLLLRYGEVIGEFSKRAGTIDSEELKGRTRLRLSPQETEILQHMANGYATRAIAYVLGLEHTTVRNHVTHVRRKLGAKNCTHAVALVLRAGFII